MKRNKKEKYVQMYREITRQTDGRTNEQADSRTGGHIV